MKNPFNDGVFDYRTLRLLIGAIAFTLPFLVTWIANTSLTSISASYHTGARDFFVGWLFVIGALMLAYNGHRPRESVASKIAGIAAVLVALFPTACDSCEADLNAKIHVVAAVVLFGILAYFCFGPFQQNTKGQPGKRGRRSKIYFLCGIVILLSLATAIILLRFFPELADGVDALYWAETAALIAFGIAWVVAGKTIPSPLVDKKDAVFGADGSPST
jgi:quinol-cytochrome oxidoreductase complex cytochrome b subunit